jgi:hypothetical protein
MLLLYVNEAYSLNADLQAVAYENIKNKKCLMELDKSDDEMNKNFYTDCIQTCEKLVS